jgi:hypothetical protein
MIAVDIFKADDICKAVDIVKAIAVSVKDSPKANVSSA